LSTVLSKTLASHCRASNPDDLLATTLVTILAVAGDLSDELLTNLRSGDDATWVRFYDSIAGDIRAYVARIGADSPDDVVGETMVQVVRSLPRFEGTAADLRPWTFRIARNRVIDAGRRRARRPALSALDPNNEPTVDGPDEVLGGDLSAMLEGLTPDQRDAVWLRYVLELSVEETAAVMDRAPDAVAALTHRALRRLRAALGPA
jgi:RNA polymerase sigma-70 factor (ECF subfamily)